MALSVITFGGFGLPSANAVTAASCTPLDPSTTQFDGNPCAPGASSQPLTYSPVLAAKAAAVQAAPSSLTQKTYTVTCSPPSDKLTTASNGKLQCSHKGTVKVVSSSGQATYSVSCSKGSPRFNGSGFSCTNGGTPKVKTVSASHGVSSPAPVIAPSPAPATGCSPSHCDLIATYLNPVINMLTVAFGVIAVVSLILGGIQYSTSEGDPQKASKAKNRLANTVLAILAYSVLYGFLQFLVPGGFFQ